MSFTSIANDALNHLGISKRLTNVATDTSTTATVMYALQTKALKKTLEAADWDFATWSVALTENESDPDDMPDEWAFSYDMPESPSCVKPRRIVNGDRDNTPGSQIPFRVVANIAERYAITGATAANPVVITVASHTFSNGDYVYIEGVVGMTELNSLRFTVANKTATTFELSGVNGTAYTAYSSGGYVRRANTLIYTDEEDAVLEYTFLNTDTDTYTEEFNTAMGYMWAYLAAPALTGGDPSGLGNKCYQLFQRELSMASARDANKRVWNPSGPESEFTRNR